MEKLTKIGISSFEQKGQKYFQDPQHRQREYLQTYRVQEKPILASR